MLYGSISSCVASRSGGAITLSPQTVVHPLSVDARGRRMDGQTPDAATQGSVTLFSAFSAYGVDLNNHTVAGMTSDPGDGAVLSMNRGGRASFDRCTISESSLPSHHSSGGFVSLVDGGALYLRDSVIRNLTATYGGVLRVYQTAHAGKVGHADFGRISVLVDNCTIYGNTARRHGAVLSAFSPSRVLVRPFEYDQSALLFTDSGLFLLRPTVRFGFTGNPAEDPFYATVKPFGH